MLFLLNNIQHNFILKIINNPIIQFIVILFTFSVEFQNIMDSYAEKEKRKKYISSLIAAVLFLIFCYWTNLILSLIITNVYLKIILLIDKKRRAKRIDINIANANNGANFRQYKDFEIGKDTYIKNQYNKYMKIAERNLSENCPIDALHHLENCKYKVKKKCHYLMLYAKGLMMLGDYENALLKLDELLSKKRKYKKVVLGMKIICCENLGQYQSALYCYDYMIKNIYDSTECYFYQTVLKIKLLEISEYIQAAKSIVYKGDSIKPFIYSILNDCDHAGKNPKYEAESYTYKGICLFYLGNYEDALDFIYDSNEINNNISHNHLYFGIYYYEKGNYEIAKVYLKKSIILDGSNHKAYYYMAQIYYDEKNYDQALEAASQSLSIFPYRDNCYFIEAECYRKKQMFREAIQQLTCAIELKPLRKYYSRRAECYFCYNYDLQRAYEDRLQCQKICEIGNICFKIPFLEILLGKIQKKDIEKIIQKYKYNSENFGQIGIIYAEIGNSEQAVYYYNKCLERDISNEEIHYDLAIELKIMGNIEKAIFHFEKTIQLNKFHLKAYQKLKECYDIKNDLEKSSKTEMMISKINKTYWQINKNNGDKAYMIHQYESAIDYYNQALLYNINNAIIINNLACAHYCLYHYEKATQYWKNLIEVVHKDYAPAYYNMANYFLCINYKEKAVDFYRRSIELAPDYQFAQEMLASLDVSKIQPWFDKTVE